MITIPLRHRGASLCVVGNDNVEEAWYQRRDALSETAAARSGAFSAASFLFSGVLALR